MASVDDIEELIATRRLNGLDDGLYESDKNVANDKDYTLAYLKGYADAEEKYRARIKELEEHQKINGELKEKIKELDKKIEKEKKLTRLAQTLTDESIKEALIEFEKDYISKQKVKDLIINETINISGFECIAVEDLKKLLKEKTNE